LINYMIKRIIKPLLNRQAEWCVIIMKVSWNVYIFRELGHCKVHVGVQTNVVQWKVLERWFSFFLINGDT
jgi:hypothetical protein